MSEEPKSIWKPTCMVPHCTNAAVNRGQCFKCRNITKRLVEEGKTTWDELVKLGVLKPGKGGVGRYPSQTRTWILEKLSQRNDN